MGAGDVRGNPRSRNADLHWKTELCAENTPCGFAHVLTAHRRPTRGPGSWGEARACRGVPYSSALLRAAPGARSRRACALRTQARPIRGAPGRRHPRPALPWAGRRRALHLGLSDSAPHARPRGSQCLLPASPSRPRGARSVCPPRRAQRASWGLRGSPQGCKAPPQTAPLCAPPPDRTQAPLCPQRELPATAPSRLGVPGAGFPGRASRGAHPP